MNKASTPEERRGYEDSVKTYRDIDNPLPRQRKTPMQKVVQKAWWRLILKVREG